MQVQYEPWHHNDNAWGVKITGGRFEGTVISINTLDLAPDDSGMMSLDFNFINKTSGVPEEEFNSPLFNTLMEKILNDILEKAIELHEHEKDRDSNITESSTQ